MPSTLGAFAVFDQHLGSRHYTTRAGRLAQVEQIAQPFHLLLLLKCLATFVIVELVFRNRLLSTIGIECAVNGGRRANIVHQRD